MPCTEQQGLRKDAAIPWWATAQSGNCITDSKAGLLSHAVHGPALEGRLGALRAGCRSQGGFWTQVA